MRAEIEKLYKGCNHTPLSFFDKLKAKYNWSLAGKLISKKAMNTAMNDVFEGRLKKGDISKELFNETFKSLTASVTEGFGEIKYGQPNYDFNNELKHNAAVFSAFKNHKQTAEMVDALTDEKGNLRSRYEFKKAVKDIDAKYNQNWLDSERNLAVKAARSAADWKEYERTKDLFPNIEYMASRAANPRQVHKKYYSLIKPIDDPIWDLILPPNGWGCECWTRKSNADVSAENPQPPQPIAGIVGNAGKTAQLFSASHPFVKNTSKKEKAAIQKQLVKLERESVHNEVLEFAERKLIGNTFSIGYKKEKLPVSFTKKNVKAILRTPHKHKVEQMRLLTDITELFKHAKFVKVLPEAKGKNKGYDSWYIYEVMLKGEKSWLHIVKLKTGEFKLHHIGDTEPK